MKLMPGARMLGGSAVNVSLNSALSGIGLATASNLRELEDTGAGAAYTAMMRPLCWPRPASFLRVVSW